MRYFILFSFVFALSACDGIGFDMGTFKSNANSAGGQLESDTKRVLK